MLLEIIQAHPAITPKRSFVGIRQVYIREVIVAAKRVSQAIFLIVDLFVQPNTRNPNFQPVGGGFGFLVSFSEI